MIVEKLKIPVSIGKPLFISGSDYRILVLFENGYVNNGKIVEFERISQDYTEKRSE